MKSMIWLKACGRRLGALGLSLFMVSGASAALTWESVGEPVPGNSWGHRFEAHGQQGTVFDSITAVVLQGGYTFEAPGMQVFRDASSNQLISSWRTTSTEDAAVVAEGDRRNWVSWTFWFNGDPPGRGDNRLELLLTAWLNGSEQALAIADYHINEHNQWVWQVQSLPVPVPEPRTFIAGAFLLLIFGVTTLRRLRLPSI